MASDPRVHKPRLPKAYSDQQLGFLKGSLPEFERRSQGSIRGDAKKFALERAQDFIVRFGLPDEFVGVDEPESRFKEQIYNWFKNTVGRNRRKLEGKPRSQKKAVEKAAALANDLGWSPSTYHAESTANSPTNIMSYQPPMQPNSSSISTALSTPAPPHLQPPTISIPLPINLQTLFHQGLDAQSLSNMIQSYVASNPSPTPLTPVVDALFDAIASDAGAPYNRDPLPYLKHFLDASSYFPPTVMHAGVPGPLAGPRALQMQIRKNAVWTPSTARPAAARASSQPPSSVTSLSDEMQRIALDRQRRKDHIQWARIHAAALELNVMGRMTEENSSYTYGFNRAFSEITARDSVWEQDEAEWVAGICVLRAVIRTAIIGDRRQREEYDSLLRTYEGRWKEIKDEARQALVAEVLLAAKDDLARLDNGTL